MTFCTKCGAKLNEGSQFCTACGTAVTAAAMPGTMQAQQMPAIPVAPRAQPGLQGTTGGSGKGLAIAALVCASVVWIMNIMHLFGPFFWSGPRFFMIRSAVGIACILLAVFSLYISRNKLALIAGIVFAAHLAFWLVRGFL